MSVSLLTVPRPLTNYQRQVLTSIGINGPQHILAIQQQTGLNYATTHRSVKTLEENNLIYLHEKDPRGPKGAQYYELTPYGIIELYLRGELGNEFDKILENRENLTPRLIINYRKIKQQFPIETILNSIIPDVTTPHKAQEQTPWHKNLLTIHRNIIDTNLLNTLSINQIESISEVIKNDPKYRDVWQHWYQIKIFFHDLLLDLNKKITE
ncbi:MarR family transcriptional regulator [Candidatus Bathyarchaeota archaeon]|nr:MAG: MarR family transcriptional regulator [Candidatus Bathyarchaeota archaeon]